MGLWHFKAGARTPGCPSDAGGEGSGAVGTTLRPTEPITPELTPLYFLLPPSWTFR